MIDERSFRELVLSVLVPPLSLVLKKKSAAHTGMDKFGLSRCGCIASLIGFWRQDVWSFISLLVLKIVLKTCKRSWKKYRERASKGNSSLLVAMFRGTSR